MAPGAPGAAEPLLEGTTAESDGPRAARRLTARQRFRKLANVVLARAPANGARVTESLDYEPVQNDLYFQRLKARKTTRKVYGYSGLTLAKNLVVIITGICTGLVSVGMTGGVGHLIKWRNEHVQAMLTSHPNSVHLPFLFNVTYGLLLTSVGALLVTFWAPTAAGAGVTLVMAYLNGNHIPNLLRLKTLAVKIIGATAGVASGLAIGPEGPMVHIGACIASQVTYFNCNIFRWLWPWANCGGRGGGGGSEDESAAEEARPRAGLCQTWEELVEDSEHREFISAGASAGLSAAFGAPIGGVLFSMEEACSFWSKKVAWRCFVAAILSAFMVSLLVESGAAGVIRFEPIGALSTYETIRQLPLMVAVAALGGTLGSMFNMFRRALWRIRASRSRKLLRIAEALTVNFISVTLTFFAPTLLGQCIDVPAEWHDTEIEPVRWHCDAGKHNDLATAFRATPDDVLGRMFAVGTHEGLSGVPAPGFSMKTLLTFGTLWLGMMSLAAGVCVPAGLFMPSVSLGASWGLAAGLWLHQRLPHWSIQPGLYSLICATAVLAGVFRSAISLVVLIVEGTRGINFLFGIIISVIVSNFTASVLEGSEGVYHSEIEHDGNVFFLRHEPPRKLAALAASDIMVPRPITFPPIVALRDVLRVLQRTTHHGFPVVSNVNGSARADGGAGGQLEGLVLRSQLLVLLRERAFCNAEGQPLLPLHATQAAQYRLERAMRMFYRTSFTHHRYASTWDPTIDSLDRALTRCESNLSVARSARSDESGGSAFGAAVDYGELPFLEGPQTEDRAAEAAQFGASCARNDANARDEAACAELARILQNLGSTERLYMDLRHYMNPAPLTVRKEMSAARVHRTFVTLGMRHLCVVTSANRVVGIITRKDLDHVAEHGAPPTDVAQGENNVAGPAHALHASTSRAGLKHRDSVYPGTLPLLGDPFDGEHDLESSPSVGSEGALSATDSAGNADGHVRALRGLRKGERSVASTARFSQTIPEHDEEGDGSGNDVDGADDMLSARDEGTRRHRYERAPDKDASADGGA